MSRLRESEVLVLCGLLCGLLAGCGSSNSGLKLGEERLSDREAQNTADMIAAIKAISLQRDPTGTVGRFNQTRTLGCFDASFSVPDKLDKKLQQGIFRAGQRYRAVLRFANATQQDDREKDFRGLSIKVAGVGGESLWGTAGQQDFVLNSYPALFAADPGDFLDFINATRDDQRWRYFINPLHFYSLPIILKGRETIDNPFAIPYWSTTPYRFGDEAGTAVKYSVRPCAGSVPALDTPGNKHFLVDAMDEHLAKQPACFTFMVQFQSDPDAMPIENAAVIWDESRSPFITVADIQITAGATSGATADKCEAMTFNPWQSLAAHRPLGGINRTRKPIYAEIGAFRSQENKRRAGQ